MATGDKIRSYAELFIEVEKDLTTYGEEVKFGGGNYYKRWNGSVTSVTTKWCCRYSNY